MILHAMDYFHREELWECGMNDLINKNDDMDEYSGNPLVMVVGVGGGGIAAINYMIEENLQGVTYAAIDYDLDTLNRCQAGIRLSIGAKVITEDAIYSYNPSVTCEDRERFKALICDANVIFITAEIDDSASITTASIVAKIAKELAILTIGIVAPPSSQYTPRVYSVSDIEALSKHVGLIVVPNRLRVGAKVNVATEPEIFETSYDMMQMAVVGIVEAITTDGLINVDVSNVSVVLSCTDIVVMGTAIASGATRAKIATEQAFAQLSFTGIDMAPARGILIHMKSSSSIRLKEVAEALIFVESVAKESTVIVSSVFNEMMGDELRVTIFATGIGLPRVSPSDVLD